MAEEDSEERYWTEEELLAALTSPDDTALRGAGAEGEETGLFHRGGGSEVLPPANVCAAIGAIVLGQNMLETGMYAILTFLLTLPDDVIGHLFASLNNRARADTIAHMLASSHFDPTDGERTALAFVLRAFDICTENRNIAAHSGYVGTQDGRFNFRKYASGPGARGWDFSVTAEELAAIGAETVGVTRYVADLWLAMRDRLLSDGAATPPLPQRPPQPRKLNLFRLPEDQQDD